MPHEEQGTDSAQQCIAANGEHSAEGSAHEMIGNTDGSAQLADEQHRVLERLLLSHETWFDVTRNIEYGGRCFAGYAEFRSHGEQYVLVKKAKLWEVDAFEYLFFDMVDVLDQATFDDYLEYMKTQAINKVDPGPNHMSSYISLVLVVNKADTAVLKSLKRTAWHKTFKFGLRGWAELRLCVLDLSSRTVITNAMGKEMKGALEVSSGFKAPGKKRKSRR